MELSRGTFQGRESLECSLDLGAGDHAKVIKWRRKPDGSGLRNSPERSVACLSEFQLERRKTEEGGPTLKMQNVGGPMTFKGLGISILGLLEINIFSVRRETHN